MQHCAKIVSLSMSDGLWGEEVMLSYLDAKQKVFYVIDNYGQILYDQSSG